MYWLKHIAYNKKLVFIILLIGVCLFSFSQTAEDIAVKKLQAFMVAQGMECQYNKFNHSINFNDEYIVNIVDVKIEYVLNENKPAIKFCCVLDESKKPTDVTGLFLYNGPILGWCGSIYTKQCVSDNSGYPLGGLTWGFSSKEVCYQIINLIADVRNSIPVVLDRIQDVSNKR